MGALNSVPQPALEPNDSHNQTALILWWRGFRAEIGFRRTRALNTLVDSGALITVS